jgi:hypothetical protein
VKSLKAIAADEALRVVILREFIEEICSKLWQRNNMVGEVAYLQELSVLLCSPSTYSACPLRLCFVSMMIGGSFSLSFRHLVESSCWLTRKVMGSNGCKTELELVGEDKGDKAPVRVEIYTP